MLCRSRPGRWLCGADRCQSALERAVNDLQQIGGDIGPASQFGPGNARFQRAAMLGVIDQAQERQLSIQRKKGVLVDRARAETLVFQLVRERVQFGPRFSKPIRVSPRIPLSNPAANCAKARM